LIVVILASTFCKPYVVFDTNVSDGVMLKSGKRFVITLLYTEQS
jgi:hypothetical protein